MALLLKRTLARRSGRIDVRAEVDIKLKEHLFVQKDMMLLLNNDCDLVSESCVFPVTTI